MHNVITARLQPWKIRQRFMSFQLEIIRRSQLFEIPTHLKIKFPFYIRDIPYIFQRLIKAVHRYKHHLLQESFENTQWAK